MSNVDLSVLLFEKRTMFVYCLSPSTNVAIRAIEGQKSDTEMTKTVVYEQTNGRDERKFGSDLVKSQFKDI